MTQHPDVARGRDVVARWCALAEQRLEYLTELFETGRWRRYHSERAFLENIQEAKSAVQIWRNLSMREAARDNSAIDLSWLARKGVTAARIERLREAVRIAPQPVPAAAERKPPEPAAPALVSYDEAQPEPVGLVLDDGREITLDLGLIEARYPVLRNAF
ncbi:TIGR03809 family protein [Bradyrhizobium sp. NP1]|jgi:uncharacterized repeat protein (TIGR03809 family)|uniref:TIGR03809 family protein n=1 Tax=Bradyrhizobium sp. NP1 TaxID=3049772 RepID=UPI0025A57803|nr:TIGR03809 family protein [Bradyrhizobium sp. NP1]WJR80727.1 TIGR03809 family protein [Bradyrhizobium sp. NP1]